MLDTDTCVYARKQPVGFEPRLQLRDCPLRVRTCAGVVGRKLDDGVASTDPLAYPPIVIESTVSMSAGQTLETRATSVRRVPLEPDTFVVPDPASDATPGE